MLQTTSDIHNLNTIRNFVETYASALSMPPEAVYGIVLAVDEAVTNIILHGYGAIQGPVEIELTHDSQTLTISLRDQARLFDPTKVPPASLSGSLEERPLGGLGLHFIRHYTDELIHRARPGGGNELILKKHLQGEK